jgi:tetratricopeptide (TPR) repeat protein
MKIYTADYEPWPKKVFQQFSHESREILLESYRYNPLGWRILFSADRFNVAAEILGKNVTRWSPLNVTLLEYSSSDSVNNHDGRIFNSSLSEIYDCVQQNAGNTSWSQTALELTFQLKTRLEDEALCKILPFLTVFDGIQQSFDCDLWALVFSILDNVLDDPETVYVELLKKDPSIEAIRLVSLAILSQTVEDLQKKERFLRIFSKLPEAECSGIIHFLYFRGAESLAQSLAVEYLEMHSFSDVLRLRTDKIPSYKQQVYLQRVEHYLVLLSVAGYDDEFQQVVSKFEQMLMDHGYGQSYGAGIRLDSLHLSNSQILEIVSLPDWELWKDRLIPPYSCNHVGIKDILRCFYQLIHGDDFNESTMANSFVKAGKNAAWFRYFCSISAYVHAEMSSEFLKEQISLLMKTSFCDYGLDDCCRASSFKSEKEKIYWSWLRLLKNQEEEMKIRLQLLSAYAKIEDWYGVIEIAEWIRKDQSLSPDGLLMLGKAYLAVDEYEESVSAARDILLMDSNNPDANFLIGVAYADNDCVEKAVDHLGKAIDYDSLNTKAWIELAKVHKRNERLALAVSTLRQGHDVLPDSPEITLELSRVLKDTGNYQEAYLILVGLEEYLTKSIEDFLYFLDLLWEIDELAELQDMSFGPGENYLSNGKVVYYRAKLYELKGRFELAVAELEDFLSHHEASKEIYDFYFELLTESIEVISFTELDCSEDKLTTLTDIVLAASNNYPQEISYKVYLIEVQLLLGQYQEAYESLQGISSQMDLLPGKMKIRVEFDLALSSRYIGETDLAMATFESLQKIHPENPNILIQLAETCMFNGLSSQVDFYAKKVINLAPNSSKIVDWFIATMKYLKDEEKVYAKLTEIIELYPESIPLKKAFIAMNIKNGQFSRVHQEIMSIVQSDIGLTEDERTEFVQIALQSDSLEIATRLIDAGGEGFFLPFLPLVHYLSCLMAEKQFGLALIVIDEYAENYQDDQSIRVLEADCHFYLKQYDISEKVLLELLKDTKSLKFNSQINQKIALPEGYPFSIEDLSFLQSPISIYLRLALAARYQGHIDDFRSYSEMHWLLI